MITAIPTFSDPFYVQQTTLDGVNYLLDFRYNQRMDRWFFSVLTHDGVALVHGIKVMPQRRLLSRYKNVLLPPGEFIAVPNGPDDSPPGLEELGPDKRVTLLYYDAAEVAAMRSRLGIP